MVMCVLRSALQSVFETQEATLASLRLLFQTTDVVEPSLVVVFVFNEGDVQFVCKLLNFRESVGIFLLRENVWVAIEYSWAYAVVEHTLNDGRRTRGATRMEQNALSAVCAMRKCE